MMKTTTTIWNPNTAYVEWRELNPNHVRASWHKVYWPPKVGESDETVYAYCDNHFVHAWTVNKDHAWFSDEQEATQFALLFGV